MQHSTDKTTLSEIPVIVLKGFGMGTADVIPGVSGGTIALITGIYDRLLAAIKSFNGEVIKAALTFQFGKAFSLFHWKFLFSLLTGIASAILFFTKVVPLPLLIYTQPEPVYGLFFGLILGSVLVISRKLFPVDLLMTAGIAAGTVIGYVTVTLVPFETPSELPFIFLYGVVAIIAMILPGISGSFILLILRKYDYIFGNIGLLGTSETLPALGILTVFAFGCLTGITLFSHVLSWLLKHYYRPTMAVLVGFLLGTLWVIWPWQIRKFEEAVKPKVVEQNDARWLALQANPENSDLPEFHRAVEENGVYRIETVKKKLIASTPVAPIQASGFLPWLLMVSGFGLVLLLDWRAGKTEA